MVTHSEAHPMRLELTPQHWPRHVGKRTAVTTAQDTKEADSPGRDRSPDRAPRGPRRPRRAVRGLQVDAPQHAGGQGRSRGLRPALAGQQVRRHPGSRKSPAGGLLRRRRRPSPVPTTRSWPTRPATSSPRHPRRQPAVDGCPALPRSARAHHRQEHRVRLLQARPAQEPWRGRSANWPTSPSRNSSRSPTAASRSTSSTTGRSAIRCT